jgi:hypothetical protein
MGEYRYLIRLVTYAVVILLLLQQVVLCQNIITTIAGGDLNHGDGGVATSAIVAHPCAVTVDSSGIYIH